jgi:hypothetical protein
MPAEMSASCLVIAIRKKTRQWQHSLGLHFVPAESPFIAGARWRGSDFRSSFFGFFRPDAGARSHLLVRRIRTSALGGCGTNIDRLGLSCFLLSCAVLFGLGKPIVCGSGTNSERNLCPRNRGKILFFQNAPVMQFVPGRDVGKGAHGDFVLVGNAAALPGIAVQP